MTARFAQIPMLPRLTITAVAAALLIFGLTYWWHGNLVHELAGTAMFALLIGHNLINRWWYGSVLRTPPNRRRWILVIVNLALLVPMVILLVTSLLISQSLFVSLPRFGGVTARELHLLAAYWVVALFSIHLGIHWTIVMGFITKAIGLRNKSAWRTWALRILSAGASAYGIYALGAMSYPAKLVDPYVLDMWDFQQNGILFLTNYAAITVLFASASHYLIMLITRRRQA